jgi:hypothetical protein
MALKAEIINQIRANKRLKRALIDYFDNSESTLQRMLKNNDSRLTELYALQIIAVYLDVNEIEQLVEAELQPTG